jgi:hypothetical protein
MAGRKSLKEEIKVVQYMTELSGPTFNFIKAMYETGDKKDKQWATEMMMKLYAKAVPQAGDDAQNPIFMKQITGMEIIDDRDNPSNESVEPVQDPVPNQEPETA